LNQDQAGDRFRGTIPESIRKKQGRAFSRLAAASSTSAVGPPPWSRFIIGAGEELADALSALLLACVARFGGIDRCHKPQMRNLRRTDTPKHFGGPVKRPVTWRYGRLKEMPPFPAGQARGVTGLAPRPALPPGSALTRP